MKQNTTPEQTAKLIALGFDKPKSSVECELPKGDWRIGAVGIRKAYSIGELLSFLPNDFRDKNKNLHTLSIYTGELGTWEINYIGFESRIRTCEYEFIDAAFEMCVKLKEEGVI